MSTRGSYEFGDFQLDSARRRLERKNGESVALNAKAFDALVHLVEHAGEPVSRKLLTAALWPNRIVEENNLTQAISAVRRALGDGYIATLAGRGYQFVAEIRSAGPDSGGARAVPSDGAHDPDTARIVPTTAIPDLTPLSTPRRFSALGKAAIAAGAVLALLAVWGYIWVQPTKDEVGAAIDGNPTVKLLVLPFASLSPDPDQRAFSDGLTDELIIRLQRLSSLRVTGRTTAFALRDSGRSVADVAAELGVQYVLEGSVGRDGDRLRIRGQLSDASGFSVWAESFERPLASIFDIQDEIVSVIAAELPTTLGLDRALRRASTQSLEAYQLSLQARAVAVGGPSLDGFARPAALLDRALQLDPQFAAAWAIKSEMHSAQYTALAKGGEGELAAAEQAAERAIDLAPDQSEGYTARALVRVIRGDWLGADSDYAQARALGYPLNVTYPLLLLSAGHFEKSRQAATELLEADPLNAGLLGFLMLSHELLGDTKGADAVYERGRALFERWDVGVAMSIWMLLGRRDIEAIIEDPDRLRIGGTSVELLGEPDQALSRLNDLALDPRYQGPNTLGVTAIWSAYHGDSQSALRSLEKAVTGAASLTYLAWLPVFDDVRRLPEFKELLVKSGLVDYWRATGWPDVCRPIGEDDFVCD